jgi:hypothetical protein
MSTSIRANIRGASWALRVTRCHRFGSRTSRIASQNCLFDSCYAIAAGTSSLLAQNLGFTVTSLIGIYRHRADLRATAGAVAQLARRNFSLPIR